MKYRSFIFLILVVFISAAVAVCDQQSQSQSAQNDVKHETKIPKGSKVYIAPMDGFESYMKNAIEKKEVPIKVVENRDEASYEITGVAESKKAGAAKILIMGSWHSREEASIRLSNLKTGDIVFAYSVHKENSAHGKKSTAEACAKHLKDVISK